MTGAPETPRASSAAYLFGLAALILAAAIFLAVWRRTESGAESSSPARTEESAPSPIPGSASNPAATPLPLPTHGPREAADAIVGAPRLGGPPPARPLSPSGAIAPARAAAVLSEPPEASVSSNPPADKIFRTRKYAKFSLSPDQTRVFLDGRYVGIADDWDNHGGGKTLDLGREGSHRLRLELPGYRTLHLEIIETPAANDETVDIGDDLKREARVDYPKIPKLDDRTVGPVEFAVDPPEAEVAEGSRILGRASAFGPATPLRLSGPAAHDLMLTAPGYKPRRIRILVCSNAGRDVARVKASLKPE